MKRRGFIARAVAFVGGGSMAAYSDLGFSPAKASATSDAQPRHASLRYTYVNDDGMVVTHEAVYSPDGTVIDISSDHRPEVDDQLRAALDAFNFDFELRHISATGRSRGIHPCVSVYSASQEIVDKDWELESPLIVRSRSELVLNEGWTISDEALAMIAGVLTKA